MPTITINDQTVEVAQGTLLIEAIGKVGIDVPRYCYHPALTTVGSCRMCQVEIKDAPDRPGRVTISCRTTCQQGMLVDTRTDGVKLARAGALEFYLSNHPLDCPICDKAGECMLQDYSFAYGFAGGRFGEVRRKGVKRTPLGGHIIFDSERCVLCTRCTRFMDEYAKAPQLAVIGRGAEATIGIFPGRPLDSNYTGNLADICPVGALTLEEFRFKSRVWDLTPKSSICPLCSRGCNVMLDIKRNELLRVRPRVNSDVNGHFMCNVGRFDYLRLANPEGRVAAMREQGQDVPPERVQDALRRLAQSLAAATDLVVVMSPRLTNEEVMLLQKVLPSARFVFEQRDVKGDDGILQTNDPAPNRPGLRALGVAEVSRRELDKMVGGASHAVVFDGTYQLGKTSATVIAHDVLLHESLEGAAFVLPGTTAAEKSGTFINVTGRLQKGNAALQPPAAIRTEFETWFAIGRELGVTDMPATPAMAFIGLRSHSSMPDAQVTFDGFPALGVPLRDTPVAGGARA
jgi:NADH-quinone oxidoreductase subunit G